MKHLLIITLLFISSVNVTNARPLTLEDIVGLPDVRNVKLSPDGKSIASLMKVDTDKYQGIVINLNKTETKKYQPLLFSKNDEFIITDIFWGNNTTLLVRAKFPTNRYGVPVVETRLLKVDINTREQSEIVSQNLLKKMNHIPTNLSDVIDILPEDKNHILVSLGGFRYDHGKTVFRIPITKKGKRKTIHKGRKNIIDWLTDAKHNVRIGIHHKNTTYVIKEVLKSGKLKNLWTFEVFSEDEVWPLGFGADNNILYVNALYEGKDAVYKVDLRDPSLKKELVFNHEDYDVKGSLKRSAETNEVVGIGYYYWDEAYKGLIKSIDLGLPDTDNLMLDISDDGNQYVLLASNDNQPGVYYLGNKKTHNIRAIAYKYNKLKPKLLSKKSNVIYSARDGLEIEGYLTLPHSRKSDKNLPTIVFPHGGPISYDGSGFDYWTQYFANKGYAVFQMNFRGSSGYGYDFMQQGLASWGQAMQDDVEDGTKWLINKGTADKDRICIAGASYGGYAALMGGVKTPDLYQCIISFAGVTDVEALVKSNRRFTNFKIVKKQIGGDYDKLWETSPLKHAKKITKPILLIHGSKDRVVEPSQSEDMYDELNDNNKVVEYYEIEGADHYLSNNEDRLQTFRAIDKFLDKYLPLN